MTRQKVGTDSDGQPIFLGGVPVTTVEKGKKNDSDKVDLSLLPPLSIIGIGRVLGMGAAKYDRFNWRGGIKYSRLLGAALRHIFAYIGGEDIDKESGISHIHHAACNLVFLGQFIEEGREELDDRYRAS